MRKKRRPYGHGGSLLEAYMDTHDVNVVQASKILQVSIGELTMVLAGRLRPDGNLRSRIHFWTSGAIPVSAWGSDTEKEPLPEHLRPPATRGECVDGPRPCPYLTCRYHLWNDIKLRHMPDGLPDETCALDVAEEGEHTLHELSYFLILTRERVRQIEHTASKKLGRRLRILKE